MAVYLSEVECLLYFVEGLRKAAAGAHALGQYQENPQWFTIRDLLESLIEKGQKLATAKAMPRSDVLAELAVREMKAKEALRQEVEPYNKDKVN